MDLDARSSASRISSHEEATSCNVGSQLILVLLDRGCQIPSF
jgi:hypothetical protein